MRIAVDARFLQSEDKPDLRDFTKEVFERLSANHRGDEFIFFTDRYFNASFNWPRNVSIVTVTPKPTNFIYYKWWYDVKLARALKKQKADVFIATYGLASLTSSVKQVLVVRDLNHLRKKTYFFYKTFYQQFFRKFVKKASGIATLSNSLKEDLASKFEVEKTRIRVIGSGVSSHYQPVEWQPREMIKEQFAKGCEYFALSCDAHSKAFFLNVIKAFSIFKKWQKSNMKLLLLGTFDTAFEKELKALSSYKFREEVFIYRSLSKEDKASIITASYALIFPSVYEGFPQPVVEALHCEVPVISSRNSSTLEFAGNAALYIDPTKPEDIAAQMKKIYKDEQLRNQLIEEARTKSKLHNWDNTARLLWQLIQQVHSQ